METTGGDEMEITSAALASDQLPVSHLFVSGVCWVGEHNLSICNSFQASVCS